MARSSPNQAHTTQGWGFECSPTAMSCLRRPLRSQCHLVTPPACLWHASAQPCTRRAKSALGWHSWQARWHSCTSTAAACAGPVTEFATQTHLTALLRHCWSGTRVLHQHNARLDLRCGWKEQMPACRGISKEINFLHWHEQGKHWKHAKPNCKGSHRQHYWVLHRYRRLIFQSF